MNEQAIAYTLYKKLLHLYPREFRDRLGESMQQTFNDLYSERKHHPARGFFVVSIFIETTMGIIQEHVQLLRQGNHMKRILTSHNTAAITSFVLSLPLGLTIVAFMFEIDFLAKPLTALFTTNGYDLNGLGRIFMIGGLLLLPVAFVLNLRPLLQRDEPARRRLFALNLIVGAIILLLIIVAWGGLLVEEIYCLRGIRCD